MGLAITVLLFGTAFFYLVVGITAATSLRLPSWVGGKVVRPRFWGAGFVLFGATILYHAVGTVVRIDPGVDLVMNDASPVAVFVALGMMWSAQRAGRTGCPSPSKPKPPSDR